LPGIDRRLKVTVTEIAELAVELCQLSGCQNASYSDETFKAKFGFAFDLLVDGEIQFGNLSKPFGDQHGSTILRTRFPPSE
jgi:hypothetical protein